MSKSHMELIKEGDFYLEPNVALTQELLGRFSESMAASDLANICMHWFKKPPKQIKKSFQMINDLRELTDIELTTLSVTGVW